MEDPSSFEAIFIPERPKRVSAIPGVDIFLKK